MDEILDEIRCEREHQDKLSYEFKDDTHSMNDWVAFVVKYLGPSLNGGKGAEDKMFRYQMIKVAAIAVAAVQAIDRKKENEVQSY